MSATEIEGQCSCNNQHSGEDRRKFLKNISLGGALLTGVPQLASAFERTDSLFTASNKSNSSVFLLVPTDHGLAGNFSFEF